MVGGLESAKLKLIRAAAHIEAVKKAIGVYLQSEPGGIVRDADGRYKLNFQQLPPPDIAVFAGEAIYQMRSSLDHLAFDLVKRNASGIQLPADWIGDCQFPLLVEVPKNKTIPLSYNAFDRRLPGITKEAFTFIEAMQPYHCGDNPTGLFYLAKLTNIDKHRHLHITKPQAHVRYTWIIGHPHSGQERTVTFRVENGANVDIPIPKGTKVKAGFTPFVSFDETGLGQQETGLTADHLLEFCLDSIERLVVPAFREFLKKP